jgi:hypothetical protein
LTVESGKLKVRFPAAGRSSLEPALAVLRANRDAVIEQVSKIAPSKPTLAAPDPEAPGIPYATWKADQLNRIFAEHGTAGPGRIKPETVQDGLLKFRLSLPHGRNRADESRFRPHKAQFASCLIHLEQMAARLRSDL